MDWQPIETAPKDGTSVDLWLVSNKRPEGFRVTDCRRSYEGGAWPDVWTEDGSRYVNGSRYYDEHDDWEECFVPGNRAHPKAFTWTKATHWRPLPDPPSPILPRKSVNIKDNDDAHS